MRTPFAGRDRTPRGRREDVAHAARRGGEPGDHLGAIRRLGRGAHQAGTATASDARNRCRQASVASTLLNV